MLFLELDRWDELDLAAQASMVEPVDVLRDPLLTTPLSLGDHVEAALASPAACRRIVRQIGEQMLEHCLDDARWESVAGELVRTARRQAQRRR